MPEGSAVPGAVPLPSRPRPRRRRRARVAPALVVLGAVYGGAILFGMPPPWPFDIVYAAGSVPVPDDLRAPADGRRRVVVLQHGLWRSAAAMGRIARTLRAAGYEVVDGGYPSTHARIEAHAQRLRDGVEAMWAAGPPPAELHFVGHSLGGLVIEEYLRRPDARAPTTCVFLGTPHRGAVLCDLRKRWWLFRLLMGTEAAFQLSPGDPFHRQPLPHPCPVGVVAGDLGEGNADIPGPDDGTVAVGEAMRPDADDTLVLPLSHTRLTVDATAIRQVLAFVRRRRFDR